MGIKNLLPFIKTLAVKVEIKDFASQTCAVDASCWLHKALAVVRSPPGYFIRSQVQIAVSLFVSFQLEPVFYKMTVSNFCFIICRIQIQSDLNYSLSLLHHHIICRFQIAVKIFVKNTSKCKGELVLALSPNNNTKHSKFTDDIFL